MGLLPVVQSLPRVSGPLGVGLAWTGLVPRSLPFGFGFVFSVSCGPPLHLFSDTTAVVGWEDTREAPCILTACERDLMSMPERKRIIRYYFQFRKLFLYFKLFEPP